MLINRFSYFTLLALTLSACSHTLKHQDNFFGFTAEQWAQLSKEEQSKAKSDYQKLVDAKNGLAQGDSREEATRNFENRALGHGRAKGAGP